MIGIDRGVSATLIVLLIWIAREDLRRFRIPNRLVLALAAGFAPACLALGRSDLLLPHALLALAALIVLVGMFAAGLVGAGDAKLLAAALLWIGPDGTTVFAALLLVAVLGYIAGAYLRLLPAQRTCGGVRIPLAPCIAAAWIGLIALGRLLPWT